MIGLTLVGFGTSTPELVTSINAALGGSPGIAVGNVVGSNIYNIWFILGLTAVIHPIPVPESIVAVDIWVMLSTSLLLLGVLWKWQRISRGLGFFFIGLYAAYIAAMI